jgi:general stress protein 26
MVQDNDIERKFWDALGDSPFLMLGPEAAGDFGLQPMTAVFDETDCKAGRLWFFTSKDNGLAQQISGSGRAVASYSSKDHDLFASIRGRLIADPDRDVIHRLWSPMIAEWYDGKDDPKLSLLRFEDAEAKIWLSDLGGLVKPALNKLLGRQPESGLDEKVAEVSL